MCKNVHNNKEVLGKMSQFGLQWAVKPGVILRDTKKILMKRHIKAIKPFQVSHFKFLQIVIASSYYYVEYIL